MNNETYINLSQRTVCDMDRALGRLVVGGKDSVKFLHSVMGMTTESGELQSEFIRWMYYNKELDRTKLIAELGDILWFMAEALDVLGMKFEEVMEANVRKLQVRFPDKYTDASVVNRDLEAETKAVLGIKE